MLSRFGNRTRLRDCNGRIIYVGDILTVSEYPNKFVEGALDYTGLVEMENGKAVCAYYDFGILEDTNNIANFPKEGRRILDEQERYEYWKDKFLGDEPNECYYKEELYKLFFAGLLDANKPDNDVIEGF